MRTDKKNLSYEDVAREALAANPFNGTLWDRVREAIEKRLTDRVSPYVAFMVGRYVGEQLERGEYHAVTPEEIAEFESKHGFKLPRPKT